MLPLALVFATAALLSWCFGWYGLRPERRSAEADPTERANIHPYLSVNRLLYCSILPSVLMIAWAAPRPESADASLGKILTFEVEQTTPTPSGWKGGPADTLFVDRLVVHSGRAAARIERTSTSKGMYSALTKSVLMDFTGKRIELRGWVRTEDVSGSAGLWLREDGITGQLEFANMQRQAVKGTTGWTEYTISLPVNMAARKLFFGFLVAGSGKGWVDDLQLLVDGRPIWEVPKIIWAESAMEADQEFDHGSKLTLSRLSPAQTENIATLAKVWGDMKYYHPRVTRGEMHWDYELFRILPRVLAAPDQASFNTLLVGWIDRFGPLPRGRRQALATDRIALNEQGTGVTNALLGEQLLMRLKSLEETPFVGQFYVSFVEGVGNPSFDNEPDYAGISLPDPGYQLLGLFRFWNIIRYWYPYRDLIGEDWDVVLREFIPRVALAKTPAEYRLEMMALIAKVSDTHANLWSSMEVRPPGGNSRLPVEFRSVENEFVVTDTFNALGLTRIPLRPGDVVTSIDVTPVQILRRQWSPYYAASNEPTRLRDMARSLGDGPAGPVKLGIRRMGAVMEVQATRVPRAQLPPDPQPHDLPGPTFRLLSSQVAYVKLSSIKKADVPKYVQQASGTKGWIIDARGYPPEFVVFALGSQFIDHGADFARFTNGNSEHPGAFLFSDAASLHLPSSIDALADRAGPLGDTNAPEFSNPVDFLQWSPSEKARYQGKIVVLIDEVTQSAAEYTVMALRAAPKTVVVGSTTAGADGNVSKIPLPGGLHSSISGIGIFYPDKRPTQRVGIVPDVEAKPTIAGIGAGRDEVLEEGIRQILGADITPNEFEKLIPRRPPVHQ